MWHRQHWVLVFWIVACGGDDDVSLDGGLDAGEMGTDAASDSGLDANVTLDSAIDADTCDDDGDGRPSIACGGDDCDDTNANRRPGVAETCDGVDDDCDARVDEGAT